MTTIGKGFVQALEAFLLTQLGEITEGAWKTSTSMLSHLISGDFPEVEEKYEELREAIDKASALVDEIDDEIKAEIEAYIQKIKDTVAAAKQYVEKHDFDIDSAAVVAVNIGTILSAAEEAYLLIATEVAKDPAKSEEEISKLRDDLLELWKPWAEPFINFGAAGTTAINNFGELFGFNDLFTQLSESITINKGEVFDISVKTAEVKNIEFNSLTLDETSIEGFLQFSHRKVNNPSAEEIPTLIKYASGDAEEYFLADNAILGIRIRTMIKPGLLDSPLLKAIMPHAEDPEPTTFTAISLDTAQGLYLGDAEGLSRIILPIRNSIPGMEYREVALKLTEDTAGGVPTFEITSDIAATLEEIMGLQIEGLGVTIPFEEGADSAEGFTLPVSIRLPDEIGMKFDSGKVSGNGFLIRKTRTYTIGDAEVSREEFSGAIQLKILKINVSAVGILSTDPFSLILIMGVRFPTAINLGLGFTLQGIGGIIAVNRGLSIPALREAMKDQIVDRLLLPDLTADDSDEPDIDKAPALIEQVGKIFPPQDGGLLIGPAAEIGWGAQKKFVTIKVAVALALPDPSITMIGGIRIQAPDQDKALTDLRADIFATINAARLLLYATLRDSRIGQIKIKGDIGLYIEWGDDGAFELSIGGFHPSYEKLTGKKSHLGELDRATIELSPEGVIKAVVEAYFALTAGTVQFGAKGRLSADFTIAKISAWLDLDVIFMWAPRFAFDALLDLGVNVEVFGKSVAGVQFRGSLKGMEPFELEGYVKIDLFFFDFEKNLGPIRWGGSTPAVAASVNPLELVVAELNKLDSWKALLPEHTNQLVSLAEPSVSADILMAHPLAGIEVSQNVVPLGYKIKRIGTSKVTSEMITLGTPTLSSGDVDAVSEVQGPFAPGHFFPIEGEKLLARGGFEQFPNGIRLSGPSKPEAGGSKKIAVSYQLYTRNSDGTSQISNARPVQRNLQDIRDLSLTARNLDLLGNPYLTNPVTPPIGFSDAGTSILTNSATGEQILPSLGPLGPTQAALISTAVSSEVNAVRSEVRTI